MALNERDFFTEKQETRADAADLSALPAEERLPAALGPANQEGSNSSGRRRARPRALREAARLHDPSRRRRALPTCRTRFEVPSHQSLVFLQPGDNGGGPSRPANDDSGRRLEVQPMTDDTSRRDFLKGTAATLGAAAFAARPPTPRFSRARQPGPRPTRCSSPRRRSTASASASSASAAWAPPSGELPRARGRRASTRSAISITSHAERARKKVVDAGQPEPDALHARASAISSGCAAKSSWTWSSTPRRGNGTCP